MSIHFNKSALEAGYCIYSYTSSFNKTEFWYNEFPIRNLCCTYGTNTVEGAAGFVWIAIVVVTMLGDSNIRTKASWIKSCFRTSRQIENTGGCDANLANLLLMPMINSTWPQKDVSLNRFLPTGNWLTCLRTAVLWIHSKNDKFGRLDDRLLDHVTEIFLIVDKQIIMHRMAEWWYEEGMRQHVKEKDHYLL